MGRKKVPTNLKIIKGTKRNCRENKDEPVLPLGIPSPPEHLSAIALIEWGRISNQLYQLGLLTEVDMAALAAYCDAFGMWCDSSGQLKKEKLTIETTNGNIIQNPLVGIVNQSREHMRKFLTEFGLSPASRAKVSVNKPDKKEDPWAEYGN